MRILATLTACLLLCTLSGCLVTSLNALYTEDSQTFDPRLVGTWATEDSGDSMSFVQDGDDAYRLINVDGEEITYFDARLVKLGDYLFLDVFPDADALDRSSAYAGLVIGVHLWARVDLTETSLTLSSLDFDWLNTLLKEHPETIQHTYVDNNLILTAHTEELQAFVLAYANDTTAFVPDEPMHRQK